jgi:hypothetical protein
MPAAGVEIEWSREGGEIAAFRVFNVCAREGRASLHAITAGYKWLPGPQAAECDRDSNHKAMAVDESGWTWDWGDENRIAVLGCTCGFWGYKNYRSLLKNLGDKGRVLALVEMWGQVVDCGVGLRAEFAEISAFVRPYADDAWFPEEELRASYPGVRIINLGEVSRVIKERKLRLRKRVPAPLQYQYLAPAGGLAWGSEDAPGVPLPVAAVYPGETLPKHGLIKVRYRDDEVGKVYAYWRRDDDDPDSRKADRQGFHSMLWSGGMSNHVEGDEEEAEES